MKLLFVWPSCHWSIFDCAVGLREGLVENGHEPVDYRLYRRMLLIDRAMHGIAPDGYVPDSDEVCLYAAEPLPYVALSRMGEELRERRAWAMIVSGMALHPGPLLALRQLGVHVAIWFTEGPYDTNEDKELYLAQFADVAFVNERTCLPAVQAALDRAGNGGVAAYLRHAYRPSLHRPPLPGEESAPDLASDVIFVGTGFDDRQALLEGIDWTGIDLCIGGMWPGITAPSHLHPHVRYQCVDNPDTVKLYRASKIAINPHRYAPGAESANPRVYELAACGTFQIADYRPEITELFGESIPTYENGVPWQLATLIRRYLAHPEERARLVALAQERVAKETFATRARQVVETLEDWEREHRPRRLTLVGAAG